jgi:hypothetical protein
LPIGCRKNVLSLQISRLNSIELRERGKLKENDRASAISHNIRCESIGCKNVYRKLLKNGGRKVKG